MNYLDLILAIPLVWGLIRGIMRGFIIELASVAALILGVFGAIHFSNYAGTLIQEYTELSDSYLPIASFAVTFILIVVAVHLLARMLQKVVKMVALGWVNRVFGGLFGLIKMGLITSFVLVFLVSLGGGQWNLIRAEDRAQSILFDPIASFGPMIVPFVTESTWYREFQVEEQIDEAVQSVDLD